MPKKNFESAIRRLEEIVSELEQSDLSLEESLQVYEEGIELTKFCTARLEESDKKIKALVKDGNSFDLKSADI